MGNFTQLVIKIYERILGNRVKEEAEHQFTDL